MLEGVIQHCLDVEDIDNDKVASERAFVIATDAAERVHKARNDLRQLRASGGTGCTAFCPRKDGRATHQ